MAGARLPGLRDREGGVALIIVLLVLALLLSVVGEFALAMRLEGRTTLNFRAALSAGHLAEAAYHRAVAEILPEAIAVQLDESGLLVFRRSQVQVLAPPERRDVPLGHGRISYRITDEASRLSLNPLPPRDVLDRLLIALGLEKEARDVIVDSILDWTDPNEDHHLNGAESDYYTGLPVPYRSKNDRFDTVDELLQVRGITRELLYGRPEAGRPDDCAALADCLTVAPTGGINLNTVSPTVLRALGVGEAQVELILKSRQGQAVDVQSIRAMLPPTVRNVTTRSSTFRIEATGEIRGAARRTLTAIVQRTGGSQVNVVGWRWKREGETP